MCGFFISNNSDLNESHFSLIEERLRFRGPDYSSGVIRFNGWNLYHSRLSIIDIDDASSNQPMHGSFGGVIVFNGEILNYKELSEKYFDGNHKSDTRLLIDLVEHGYLDLNELDGFFAFCYIDKAGELKHCAKDKFGVKPLFVYSSGSSISISSEPTVLKELFDLDVSSRALEEYKCFRAPIFSGSYFENIVNVEPGSCLVTGKYFSIESHVNDHYEQVSTSDIQRVLKESISLRCVSDAPVGLLLSKGIDSNLIASLADFDSYFSIGFKNDEDVEYLLSQNIPNLDVKLCTNEEYKEAFEYLLALRGEPLSVPNEVLLYLISKRAAQKGIKVLLSGEGADEFFGGYDRVFTWANRADKFDLDDFVNLYCYDEIEKDGEIYNKLRDIFSSVSEYSVFEQVRWFFIKYHLPVLFRRLDFSLMAAGVEGREPLANFRVFELAMKLAPSELMREDGLGKIPLRKCISHYKGEQFAYDKKVGFPVDLKKVFPENNAKTSYDIWFNENTRFLTK
ncbi:asparagine synthase-related protein [Enterovibrio sp. Hal110]